MTRTKKWDESSRTRYPGTRWRSRSWTSGPPAPPARTYPPLNLLDSLFYNINYFKVPKICILTSGLQVTSKRTKLYSAFWRENSRNHFNCSMVLAARAFGLLPSAAATIIGHQWWPGCHWYRSVSYTQRVGGHWSLMIQMPPMSVVVGKSPNSDSKAFSESLNFGPGLWSRLFPFGPGKYKYHNTETYQTSATIRG